MHRLTAAVAAGLLLASAAGAGETPAEAIARLKAENAALSRRVAALEKEKAEADARLKLALENAKLLLQQAKTMRAEVEDTRKLMAILKEENISLSKENAAFKTRKKLFNVHPAVDPSKQVDLRTKVVDVRLATGHVALGAGKDSGVREGQVFAISRDGTHVGKVRVTTVWKNFSGGVIIERKDIIKPGDDAKTVAEPAVKPDGGKAKSGPS